MINLIVYGSLINKQELLNKNISQDRCIPIIVKGLKREFSQEPSWRKSTLNDRAVLSVFPSKDHHINGILIKDIKESELIELDHRERGYQRIEIDLSQIETKYGKNKLNNNKNYIYMGKKQKYNNKINPNPQYLELCISGAKSWGDDFYVDFINTTYSKNKILRELITY